VAEADLAQLAEVVVVDLEHLVVAATDHVLAALGDGERVDFAFGRAFDHADALPAFDVPVGDVARRASGDALKLLTVEHDLFEHGFLEHAAKSGLVLQIPDDAGAVGGDRDPALVVLGEDDAGDE